MAARATGAAAAAPALRAGKTAWRIVPPAEGARRQDVRVVRCVIMRVLAGHIETAPSLMSEHRHTVPAADVFPDEAAAKAEARRRRDQGKLL